MILPTVRKEYAVLKGLHVGVVLIGIVQQATCDPSEDGQACRMAELR